MELKKQKCMRTIDWYTTAKRLPLVHLQTDLVMVAVDISYNTNINFQFAHCTQSLCVYSEFVTLKPYSPVVYRMLSR